jgi:hypothetical protein
VSEPRLSASTKELVRAARSDAPTAAAKAKVWASVSSAIGAGVGTGAGVAGAGGAGGAGTAAAAGGGAAKMLALGTLFGGTVTVGLAVTLLRVGPAPTPLPTQDPARIVAIAPVHTGSPGEPPPAFDPFLAPRTQPPPAPDPFPPRRTQAAPTSGVAATLTGSCPVLPAAASAPSPAASAPHGVTGPALDDAIAREASLVAEARGALVRGDPMAALRIVHVARGLPSHRLGPEELSVEAQALRALGRDEEAHETDVALRKQFPESALAR